MIEALTKPKTLIAAEAVTLADLKKLITTIDDGMALLNQLRSKTAELYAHLQDVHNDTTTLSPEWRSHVKQLYHLMVWAQSHDEKLEEEVTALLSSIPEIKKELRQEHWRNFWKSFRLIF